MAFCFSLGNSGSLNMVSYDDFSNLVGFYETQQAFRHPVLVP